MLACAQKAVLAISRHDRKLVAKPLDGGGVCRIYYKHQLVVYQSGFAKGILSSTLSGMRQSGACLYVRREVEATLAVKAISKAIGVVGSTARPLESDLAEQCSIGSYEGIQTVQVRRCFFLACARGSKEYQAWQKEND
jgi:hypothetical protein